jgi:hypothetical protein
MRQWKSHSNAGCVSALPSPLRKEIDTCQRLRKRKIDSTTSVATFPLSAQYAELVGHCEMEHDAALEALAGMSTGEIAEMRQRLQAAAR